MLAFKSILNSFETISLEEMDGVKLMDRVDTKYTFTANLLPQLLQKLKQDYRVLSITGITAPAYKTLYYDTCNFELYLKHHSGALNRYKIRYRNYVESNLAFLEVKFKNNKGRTLKDRIKYKDAPDLINEAANEFLVKKSPYSRQVLKPVVWINYNRITLVDKLLKERVTIDINLEFNNSNKAHKMQNLVIAEVKRVGRAQSQISNVFKELKIKPVSLSKYCMAIAFIYPELKKNNFKQKLNSLNKIMYDHSFNLAADSR